MTTISQDAVPTAPFGSARTDGGAGSPPRERHPGISTQMTASGGSASAAGGGVTPPPARHPGAASSAMSNPSDMTCLVNTGGSIRILPKSFGPSNTTSGAGSPLRGCHPDVTPYTMSALGGSASTANGDESPPSSRHPGAALSALSDPFESTSMVTVGGSTRPIGTVMIGGDTRGKVTKKRPLTNPALTDVLHLRDPLSVPFSHLFPSLASLSISELIEISGKYLKARATEVAANAARSSVAENPGLAIDRSLVALHAERAALSGLRTLLGDLSIALRPKVLQSLSPGLAHTATVTWHARAAALWDELVHGARMVIPNGFVPSGSPLPRAPPALDTQLAFEVLVRGDQVAGRACVIPLALFAKLATTADLSINEIPVSIAMKEGKASGRLVVDATRGGLNTPDKKTALAAKWGYIVLPDCSYCTLFMEVKLLFPAESLHVYKMDKEAWYRRIPVHIDDSPLSFFVVHVDNVAHAVLPLGMTFGLQDSNYTANFAGSFVDKFVAGHEHHTYGGRVSALYSDDTVGFLPQRLIQQEISYSTSLFEETCGVGVIKKEKSTTGPTCEVIGFTFDCDLEVVSLSVKAFLKMICVLFRELPESVSTATRVPLKQIQRMAALMIRNASLIHFLRPFSRGASANSTGRRHSMVNLSAQTVVDVYMWRSVFAVACSSNVSWMTLPIRLIPTLHQPSHEDEDHKRDRWRAQAAAATVLIHVDACRSESFSGIGFVESRAGSLTSWAAFPSPPSLRSLDYRDLPQEADINICESFAFIVALSLVAPSVAGTPSSPTHVHVWTDNTSALCWMTTFRAAHPLILFFLQLVSHIQARFCLVITAGHIPGLLNVLADAASRDFACPNGKQSFETLSTIPRLVALPGWVTDTMPAMIGRCEVTWQQAQETLTRVASMRSAPTL